MAAQTSQPAASTAQGGMATSASNSSGGDASAQGCADCAGKGMAPMVKGTAVDENGVQVIKIGVVNGYYSPNEFMVKAGTPVKVVFTGKAKGCLAKPQFKTLGKKADFTTSGTATIDLGTVSAGTYDFACGMGMTGGKIVAQ
jgi:plastocyanin